MAEEKQGAREGDEREQFGIAVEQGVNREDEEGEPSGAIGTTGKRAGKGDDGGGAGEGTEEVGEIAVVAGEDEERLEQNECGGGEPGEPV
jgi:hypothetical protein